MIAAMVSAVAVLVGIVLDALLARLNLPGGSPSAVLVVVVTLGVFYGRKPGAYAGFAAGLAVDLVPPGGPVLGRMALVLCLIGYVAGTARPLPSRRLVLTLLVAMASVAATVMGAATSEILGAAVPWGAVAGLLPTTVAYNIVGTVVVGFLLLRVARRVEPRSYRMVPYAASRPPRPAGRR